MARRIALNLGQRTALANGGRGSFGNRGRGRGKGVGRKTDTEDTNEAVGNIPTSSEETQGKKSQATSKIREEKITIVDVPADDLAKTDVDLESHQTAGQDASEEPSRGRKRAREPEGEEDEKVEVVDSDMMRLMGFESFDTTKNKHVKGVDCFGISFKQKTEYRQYMNREGGFNRNLSPTRGDRKRIKISLKKK